MSAGGPTRKPLEPDELLRVMDAVQVIRARQESLDQDAFDRDATVREIQVMYEELGDLVDADVIERALDEFLSERYAYRPPPKTFALGLAWLYVRRSMLARRVLAPVVVVGGLGAGVVLGNARIQRRALTNDAALLRARVTAVQSSYLVDMRTLEELRSSAAAEAWTGGGVDDFRARTTAAEGHLRSVEATLSADLAPARMPDEPTREDLLDLSRHLTTARTRLANAERELMAARDLLRVRDRVSSLFAEVPMLLAAIHEVAEEPGVAESQAGVAAAAERQAAARDLQGLEASVAGLRRTLGVLEHEYRVEIVGGVWLVSNDDPNIRRYYLRVQALGADGSVVAVSIRNEEDGRTEVVREWGERVSREVYDRVAADKQDNGIIDESDFGAKRRGWLTMDRIYPDIGQITRWDDA